MKREPVMPLQLISKGIPSFPLRVLVRYIDAELLHLLGELVLVVAEGKAVPAGTCITKAMNRPLDGALRAAARPWFISNLPLPLYYLIR